MPERFFGTEIKVVTTGEVKMPESFILDGWEYQVKEVLEVWYDSGFGNSETSCTWRTRHHRSYYRLETTDGEVYELYFDRGTNLRHPQYRKWYVTQRLSP